MDRKKRDLIWATAALALSVLSVALPAPILAILSLICVWMAWGKS